MRPTFHLCIAFALLSGSLAQAGTVVVVTSFPKEVTQPYKTAFEKANPGIKLEFLNKSTMAGATYISGFSAGERPDIFWASAPDAFEVLAKNKLLEPIGELVNPAVPKSIGSYPLNDPDGFYLGQALGGYGLMWNTRYLATHKLPAPAEWADLVKPVYHGHVAMSAPSRSGTTHLTVETILQGEGWDKGWTRLLQIAGNSAAITERSFGVPEGVNSGQYGIGLVIDFMGLSGKYSGSPVEFAYPTLTTLVPASIGLVSGGKNTAEAKSFVAYTLSREGQELLVRPEISRLPILPRGQVTLPDGYPQAVEISRRVKVKFNPDLSAERYAVVSSLFDQAITLRHKELKAVTKSIQDAEAALALKPNPQGEGLVRQARELAFTPVVGAAAVADKSFLAGFGGEKKNVEAAWGAKATENYSRARLLAEQAAALAK